MGKGLALQFREIFPENYRIYRNACKKNELHIGNMLVVNDYNPTYGHKIIINFPTKTHWRMPSEYSYIELGLQTLRNEIINRDIKSIAIPPLGSHNGGLDWLRVKPLICNTLSDLDCDIYLYEPSDIIIERLKSERVKLTAARAMLLILLGDMTKNGEFASIFAAEKVIYFLQRFGASDIFKIDYVPYYYGPYSGGKVAHLLYSLNGSYIKGMRNMQNRPFDYIWLLDNAVQDAKNYIDNAPDSTRLYNICNKTMSFLCNYYSNYSLELLSSVDYMLKNVPALEQWQHNDDNTILDILTSEIQCWSKRKGQLFQRNYLYEAYNYLKSNL